MKRLFYIATLIIVAAACTKKIEKTTPSINPPSDVPEVFGAPTAWTSLPVPSDNPLNSPTGTNIIIPVNGTVFCVLGGTVNPTVYKLNAATTRWELFTSFAITVDHSRYLFSRGTKIYWGFFHSGEHNNSFSCIDVVTGVKTTLATFPGVFVDGATTFVIGDKGYLLGGYSLDDQTVNQHWEYNFLTNQWTNKGNSPLGARSSASAFVVGNKAYIGLGFTFLYLNGHRITIYKKDWISYTPGSGFYGIMADFPAASRAGAKGFIIDGLPYVGFGGDGTNNLIDLWRYNIPGNNWTQQTSWPGMAGVSSIGTFTFNNTGYLVRGGINQFWSYGN